MGLPQVEICSQCGEIRWPENFDTIDCHCGEGYCMECLESGKYAWHNPDGPIEREADELPPGMKDINECIRCTDDPGRRQYPKRQLLKEALDRIDISQEELNKQLAEKELGPAWRAKKAKTGPEPTLALTDGPIQ